MTGVKISTLPWADAALDTDQLEVNQGGTSRRVTVGQINAAQVQLSSPTLDLRSFGVFGNDNVALLVDETAGIQAALTAAATTGYELLIPSTNYLMSSAVIQTAFDLHLRGLGAPPVFHMTQAASDASALMFTFEEGPSSTLNAINLNVSGDQTIWPNMKRIKLSDVSQLRAGMMVLLGSNTLWYYDPRDEWNKGELHKIAAVLPATSEVEVVGATWDYYGTNAVEVVDVWAFEPNHFSMENITLQIPTPTNPAVSSPLGLRIGRIDKPIISNLAINGMVGGGLVASRNWHMRVDNLWINETGLVANAGAYGVTERADTGTYITNLHGRNCRRVWDCNMVGISSNFSCPTRNTTIDNFSAHGGGVDHNGDLFAPQGPTESFGVGSHGPCENLTITNGRIENVYDGITVRGRNTVIRGVDFQGWIGRTCIEATYGEGLMVSDCTYNRNDHPTKITVPNNPRQTYQAPYFIQLGNNEPGNDWRYTSPTKLSNIHCMGTRNGFMAFGSSGGANKENIYIDNVMWHPRVVSGETAYFLHAMDGPVNLTGGSISNISMNRLFAGSAANVGILRRYHPDITVGVFAVSTDGWMDEGVWIATLATPTGTATISIPNKALQAVQVDIMAMPTSTGVVDTTLCGTFILFPSSATSQTLGFVGSNLQTTTFAAVPTVGKLGVSLSSSATAAHQLGLYNNTAAELRVRVKLT